MVERLKQTLVPWDNPENKESRRVLMAVRVQNVARQQSNSPGLQLGNTSLSLNDGMFPFVVLEEIRQFTPSLVSLQTSGL